MRARLQRSYVGSAFLWSSNLGGAGFKELASGAFTPMYAP